MGGQLRAKDEFGIFMATMVLGNLIAGWNQHGSWSWECWECIA